MSHIAVSRQLNLSAAQIKELVGTMVTKLQRRYGVEFEWQGDQAVIRGPGLDGECLIGEGSLDLNLKLGFLVAAFKPKIQQEIEDYLDRLEQSQPGALS